MAIPAHRADGPDAFTRGGVIARLELGSTKSSSTPVHRRLGQAAWPRCGRARTWVAKSRRLAEGPRAGISGARGHAGTRAALPNWTYRLRNHDLVPRRPPEGKPRQKSAYDMGREYRSRRRSDRCSRSCLEKIASDDLPVLGCEFYVMRRP